MAKREGPKIPLGCLIVVSLGTMICWAGTIVSSLTNGVSSKQEPTAGQPQITTSPVETALASNLQVLALESPTIELTITPFKLSTNTAVTTAIEVQTETAVVSDFAGIEGATCIPNNTLQIGRVLEVVDGDTIRVILDEDGLTYSVRYIGIDTPENTSQVEYFGPEATAKNIELVAGKSVSLIKDVSETDLYGRLLRYVLVENLFVNYALVAQGYANTASFPPDISCISTFQVIEQRASASKLGLWGSPPTLVAIVPDTSSTGSNTGGNAACNCGGPDLNCPDLGSHANAQACFDYCRQQGYGDVFRLDRDNDGLACENN